MKVSQELTAMPGGRTIVRALGKYGTASEEQLSRGAIAAQYGINPSPFDEKTVLEYLKEHGIVNTAPDGRYELSGIGEETLRQVGREFTLSLTPFGREVAKELWGMNFALRGINPDSI